MNADNISFLSDDIHFKISILSVVFGLLGIFYGITAEWRSKKFLLARKYLLRDSNRNSNLENSYVSDLIRSKKNQSPITNIILTWLENNQNISDESFISFLVENYHKVSLDQSITVNNSLANNGRSNKGIENLVTTSSSSKEIPVNITVRISEVPLKLFFHNFHPFSLYRLRLRTQR